MMIIARTTDRHGDTLVEFEDGMMVAVMCSIDRVYVRFPKEPKAPLRDRIVMTIPQRSFAVADAA